MVSNTSALRLVPDYLKSDAKSGSSSRQMNGHFSALGGVHIVACTAESFFQCAEQLVASGNIGSPDLFGRFKVTLHHLLNSCKAPAYCKAYWLKLPVSEPCRNSELS